MSDINNLRKIGEPTGYEQTVSVHDYAQVICNHASQTWGGRGIAGQMYLFLFPLGETYALGA